MSKRKSVIALSIAFNSAIDICTFIKSTKIDPSLILPPDMVDQFNNCDIYDDMILDYIESDITEFIYLLGDELFVNNTTSVNITITNNMYQLNIIKHIDKKRYKELKKSGRISKIHDPIISDTGNY